MLVIYPCPSGTRLMAISIHPTPSLTLLPQICISPDRSLSSYLYLSLIQLMLQLKWLCIHLPPFTLTTTPVGKALLIPFCNGPLTGPQPPLLPLQPSSTMLPRTIFLTHRSLLETLHSSLISSGQNVDFSIWPTRHCFGSCHPATPPTNIICALPCP